MPAVLARPILDIATIIGTARGDLSMRSITTVFLAVSLGLTACGGSTAGSNQSAEPLEFRVDESLRPEPPTIPGQGAPRTIAVLRSEKADLTRFVENQLVVRADSTDALDPLLRRWSGTIVQTLALPKELGYGNLNLLRVNPDSASTDKLPQSLRSLSNIGGGNYTASSIGALKLLQVAAEERQRPGLEVNLNLLGEPAAGVDDYVRRRISDPGVRSAGDNAFEWSQTRNSPTQDIGVAEAWRRLFLAGKVLAPAQALVRAVVIDGGFARSPDLPHATLLGSTFDGRGRGTPNPVSCSGAPCPFHGASVAHALAALPNNGFGVAGPGGIVTSLAQVQVPGGAFDAFGWVFNTLITSLRGNPKIINLSGSIQLTALLFPLGDILGRFVTMLRGAGVLVFAAAGNQGTDIDAETCFVACWESIMVLPCEAENVICVGGLDDDSTRRDPGSNFGQQAGGHDGRSVDIFGPFHVNASDPADPAAFKTVSGTSLSTPFVAGVAALIWAAKPDASADDVERILLSTAHTGSADTTVNRWVDADAAVANALGAAPCRHPGLDLRQPVEGAQVLTGQPVLLQVVLEPIFNVAGVRWFVDGRQIAGGTAEHRHTFGTAAPTEVAVEADGCRVTRRITAVRPDGSTGAVRILSPANGSAIIARVDRNTPVHESFMPVTLTATATDRQGRPAAEFRWHSSLDNQRIIGNQIAASIRAARCVTAESRITVEAFDSAGQRIGTAVTQIRSIPVPC